MASTLELKRRIKSISSTKKITRAMQMVSAVKMRKAQSAAVSSRTYANLAWQIITNIAEKADPQYQPLLNQNTKSKKIGIVLITTNRGMVGAFNTNLVNAVNKLIAENNYDAELLAEVITIGRKGRDAMLRMGKTLFAEFDKVDRTILLRDILPMAELISNEYVNERYSKIFIAYTNFVSTINQKPVIKQLLPFQNQENHRERLPEHFKKYNYEYLFEPDPEKILNHLVPRIIESQIYQAILESDASEHSARMVMMKNATDAANELITDLTLTFNQARQSNITKELAEITAGRIALE